MPRSLASLPSSPIHDFPDGSELPVGHGPCEGGGIAMKRGNTPSRDLALLTVAVVLMLGGAVTLVGGWIAAGIAIPAIAVGIALVVIEQCDIRRQHAKHIRGT